MFEIVRKTVLCFYFIQNESFWTNFIKNGAFSFANVRKTVLFSLYFIKNDHFWINFIKNGAYTIFFHKCWSIFVFFVSEKVFSSVFYRKTKIFEYIS